MVTATTFSSQPQEIIGLMPAGGQATRIVPISCSKEIFPAGFHRGGKDNEYRPKVVCHYLLEKMQLAGASKAYIILRRGKWDIPAYLGDGTMLGLNLAYLMMNLPFGAPYTLGQAYPFVKDALITFGFPDILFEPTDAFVQLLARQAQTGADLVLGLFPVDNPQKVDLVEFDDHNQICRIVIKPTQTDLQYTWLVAVWSPVFTRFMHEVLLDAMQDDVDKEVSHQTEIYVGHVIEKAIEAGLNIGAVPFTEGKYLDIGTPDDLIKAGSRQIELLKQDLTSVS